MSQGDILYVHVVEYSWKESTDISSFVFILPFPTLSNYITCTSLQLACVSFSLVCFSFPLSPLSLCLFLFPLSLSPFFPFFLFSGLASTEVEIAEGLLQLQMEKYPNVNNDNDHTYMYLLIFNTLTVLTLPLYTCTLYVH